ncbi:MAG: hypothetical protein KatS3mg009_0927 [Acidimicrobiia bacterium]|nr:MAG: hypothetical protein KatS3mg009_0927 [Acidimicrobiia bacterium]
MPPVPRTRPSRLRIATGRARVAALGGVGVAAPPAAAAPADDLAARRAEAARLQAEIARNGTRISQLDEAYNEARVEIAALETELAGVDRQLTAAAERARQLGDEVAARAARLYMGAGTGGTLPTLDVDAVIDLGSRAKYGAAAAARDQALLEELDAAREDLQLAQAGLERRRAAVEAERAELERTRDALEAAQREQEELLARVEGEIGRLVAQIEQQRRAEEEARVRAELERRAREEHRAPAPAGTPSASPGPDGGVPPEPAAPAPTAAARVAVDTALAQLGKPYEYAAAGPDSFDCSGLTMFAWAAAGVSLPHSSRAQYSALPKVSRDQLAPGDLVFYGSPIHHVGIYIGGGRYVHAPQTGDVVKISSIYRSDWAGAARPG